MPNYSCFPTFAKTWLERDEEEALREIHSSLRDDTSRIFVYSLLLDSIASDSPQRAFEAASGIADVHPSVGGRLDGQCRDAVGADGCRVKRSPHWIR